MLSKDFIPFVTPLAGYGDLKAVLKGVQALRINQDTDLDEIRDRLMVLSSSPTRTPRWSVRKARFLEQLSGILESLPKPKTPSRADLEKVTAERDGYQEEANSLALELKTLQLKYAELDKRKDKEAVKEVELQFSDAEEQFEALQREVQKSVARLSPGVREALFYAEREQAWFPGEDWTGRLDDDIERGVLLADGPQVYPNENHPKIRPVLADLAKLRRFVERASEGFCEAYEDRYQDELKFTTRGFWERHI